MAIAASRSTTAVGRRFHDTLKYSVSSYPMYSLWCRRRVTGHFTVRFNRPALVKAKCVACVPPQLWGSISINREVCLEAALSVNLGRTLTYSLQLSCAIKSQANAPTHCLVGCGFDPHPGNIISTLALSDPLHFTRSATSWQCFPDQ